MALRFSTGLRNATIGTVGMAGALNHTSPEGLHADEWLLPKGTAYLSDAGFTGPHDSVLGREVEPIIKRFLTQMPQRFDVASGRVLLQGAVVDIDEVTGLARSIVRVSEALGA